jgi:hypothetical protein
MKSFLKQIHQVMAEGCYPLDPMIVYIFGLIVLLGALIQILP